VLFHEQPGWSFYSYQAPRPTAASGPKVSKQQMKGASKAGGKRF
jgi:hypothetical protein